MQLTYKIVFFWIIVGFCCFKFREGDAAAMAAVDCSSCSPCPTVCNTTVIERLKDEKNKSNETPIIMQTVAQFVTEVETYVESESTRIYIVISVAVFLFLVVMAAFIYMIFKLKRKSPRQSRPQFNPPPSEPPSPQLKEKPIRRYKKHEPSRPTSFMEDDVIGVSYENKETVQSHWHRRSTVGSFFSN